MLQARESAGLTQKQVCEALGMSQSTLSELEREAGKSGRTVELARLYGVSAEWLATGEGSATPGLSSSQAQHLSHLEIKLPQHVQWGDLMSGAVLPPWFTLALGDDALFPEHPRGKRLIFERVDSAEAGQVVVVEDSHGERCVRIYTGGRGGRWTAAATRAGHDTLDSVEHGLKVLAVARYGAM